MRIPPWRLAPGATLSEPDYPPDALHRHLSGSAPGLRRRLTDRVEDIFHEACLSGNLEIAEDLLWLMEKMYARRRFNDQRAQDNEALVRARQELAIRKASRQGDDRPGYQA